MPKPLFGHGMVNYGTDLVVMGGYSNWPTLSPSFNQLSVENGIFKWEKMKPKLKIPRSDFVAMTIPDHLIEPSPEYDDLHDLFSAMLYFCTESRNINIGLVLSLTNFQ